MTDRTTVKELIEKKSAEYQELANGAVLGAGVARSLESFSQALVGERSQAISANMSNGSLLKEWAECLIGSDIPEHEEIASRTVEFLANMLACEVARCGAAAASAGQQVLHESIKIAGKAEAIQSTLTELKALQVEEG